MTQQHPITPPPELVKQWTSLSNEMEGNEVWMQMAIFASQWGADQELEACCEWLEQQTLCGHQDLLPSLRAARRPKPPSLKEQALVALEDANLDSAHYNIIRNALEQLDD
jgi:hypothetical protein